MLPSLQEETGRLVRSWNQHAPSWLSSYLVSGVEDPRVNLQSILTRHFVVAEVAGNQFAELMAEEYRFAACMNWLLKLLRQSCAEEMASVLFALSRGADNAEGLQLPAFLVQAYARLPVSASGQQVPNYIHDFLSEVQLSEIQPEPRSVKTFQTLWCERLASERQAASRHLTVLEPACGSANDYRFLDSYGIAPWLDYTGFDLCEQNIANARSQFPKVRFESGNVFEINSPDKAFDLCITHDLLEHLSLDGMQTAVGEICRVTRQAVCIGFFQMDEIRDHLVRPVDEYHWNLLSMRKMRDLFAQHGFTGQVIHVGSFLNRQVGCEETHNPNAYTFLLRTSA